MSTVQAIPHMPIRDEAISNGLPEAFGRQTEVEFTLPGYQSLPHRSLESLQLPSSCAKPTSSMLREQRWEEHTIWTAIAPEAVFTVQT